MPPGTLPGFPRPHAGLPPDSPTLFLPGFYLPLLPILADFPTHGRTSPVNKNHPIFFKKRGKSRQKTLKSRSKPKWAGRQGSWGRNLRLSVKDFTRVSKKKSDTLISDARKQASGLMGDAERILTDARNKQGS